MTKERLLKELIEEGYLKTPEIIEAFQNIDRKDFVPETLKDEAYGNYPLPIGFGQTISQPLTVAFMLEMLQPKLGEKILDVGSGSGWQTALLAYIVSRNLNQKIEEPLVIAIEIIPELAQMTEENVKKYNFLEKNVVKVINDDGSRGYEPFAPFDKIIAAASAQKIPEAWKKQLKIGGRIVAPVKNSIFVLEKINNEEFLEKEYFGFTFVPLIEKS